MKKITFLLILFLGLSAVVPAQTGVGIGIYPTGTDIGVGLRSSKTSKWLLDARLTKANLYNTPTLSSFTTEASAVCRLIRLEKVRFHVGLGVRTEWNFAGKRSKVGGVIPVGVEAFPFPFQNAGLFFEVAPYFTHDFDFSYSAGLRSVAGFIFYFPTKEKATVPKT
ncbi:MAG: hypothetical protein JWP12_2775 [Bacteroidetes bacterium]|nr:hypothetical protein [Bacteroidota bacterium]